VLINAGEAGEASKAGDVVRGVAARRRRHFLTRVVVSPVVEAGDVNCHLRSVRIQI